MSVDYLRFIPTKPGYDPPLKGEQRVKGLLASFVPRAAEIEVERYDRIIFVDAGQNWERINCPTCGVILEDDVWREMVDQAEEKTLFTHLTVTMPCCGATSSLNDLHYGWPMGFARFVLQARDPDGDVSQKQQSLLESLLGCSLRKIWSHY